MAEQLAFEQLRRQRAQIDAQEHFRRPLRAAMDLARDQFLAGSVLAKDEHVRIGRRRAADRFEHALHRRRIADEFCFGVRRGGKAAIAAAQLCHFEARTAQIGRGDQSCQQPFVFPGLDDKIRGTVLHRLNRKLDIAMRGHQHNHGVRIERQHLRQLPQTFGAVIGARRKIHVEQQDVERVLPDQIREARWVAQGLHGGKMLLQQKPRG